MIARIIVALGNRRFSFMICCHSYPFKEPGGHRVSAGGSGHALPGPHQTARACVCTSGGSQGKALRQVHTNPFKIQV